MVQVQVIETDVLIIGGGDGLTAREVLKYEDVEHLDLVRLVEI